ncbi:MAG: energy transducer TonB [Paludibacteraceae bacterium]|nr:energy transducer TonB [Paludibacteraceae bacterium]
MASIPFISLSGDEKIVAGIFILSVVLPFLAKNLKDRKSFAKHFLSILGDILIAILIISSSLILIVSPLYTSVSFVLANILKLTTTFLFVVGVPVIFFFRQLTPGEKRPFSSTFFYILTNLILSPLTVLCTICVYLSAIAILSGCEINSDTPLILMIVYFILVFIARKGHDVAGIHLFDRFFDNLKFIIIVPTTIFWILFFSLLSCPCENGWHYLQHSWLYFYIGIFMIVVDIFLLFKKTDNNQVVWWVGLILSELITFVPYLQIDKSNARLCMTQVDKFLENNKLIDSTGRLTQDTIRETDFDSHEFHRFNNARITVYCNDSSLLSNKNPYIIYKDWQEYQPKQITETEVEIKKDTILIDSIHVAYNGQISGHKYVDLGLPSGTLWATQNLGASSWKKLGNTYSWGETSPHKNKRYKFINKNDKLTRYCTDSVFGRVDSLVMLLPQDDAASTHWGKQWCIPTDLQWKELESYCEKENIYENKGDINPIGWLYTSKTNGEKLYIPLNKENHTGYWSSILDVSCDNQAICIEHSVYNPVERIENICHDYHYLQRGNPYHIRPVKCDKQEQKKAEDNFWQDTTIIYSRVEKKAEYIGGKEALFRDIKNNLVYPEKAKKEMMEGRVFVKFVVKRDSSTCNHEIVRGVDPDLDQAALQTVKKLGRWEPAKINGKSVNSYFMLPITFRLSDACR